MSRSAHQDPRQDDVHGVVCGDVVAESPGSSQEIEMRVAVEIEVPEIQDRFARAVSPNRAFVTHSGRSIVGEHQFEARTRP